MQVDLRPWLFNPAPILYPRRVLTVKGHLSAAAQWFVPWHILVTWSPVVKTEMGTLFTGATQWKVVRSGWLYSQKGLMQVPLGGIRSH